MTLISLRVLKPCRPSAHRWGAGYDVLGASVAPDQIATLVDASYRIDGLAGPLTEITLKTGAVLLVDEKIEAIQKKIREATK